MTFRPLLDVPKFATIAESAELTGLSKYLIRKLVLTGNLKYIKSGKKYLIQQQGLLEYLNTCNRNNERNINNEEK